MRGSALADNRSEKAIQNDILIDVSSWDETMVFRNNTGMAWQGEKLKPRVGSTITVEPGMVILRNGRPVRFGLEGSADIIGASQRYPLAIEVKDKDGKQTAQQAKFQEAWTAAGGVYILARSVKDVHQMFFDHILS